MSILAILYQWLIPTAYAAPNYWLEICLIFSNPCLAGGDTTLYDAGVGMARFVATFVWGGCTVAILWGAVKIAASGGNDEGKTQGKNIIMTAMIGFALALAAQVIINFVDATFVL